ncbi:MAG: glyoxalase/bleomycin resistance/extradiol dioxygenase family protein [Mucilaginibacter polytrichastri]|nr:glyoxalase/bleomycin resistance/extradiol dioxygenase family protein [Mucilaginibacter polytrichastri]
MSTKIFVNLPVKELARTTEFFTGIGYTFNQQFTDENATCMVINEHIYVMLLVEPFFQSFTKQEIADTSKVNECTVCLSAESREEVDSIIAKAEALGATPTTKQDHGFMYGHGFRDLDGHIWEYMWMDPATIQ